MKILDLKISIGIRTSMMSVKSFRGKIKSGHFSYRCNLNSRSILAELQ